MAKIRTIKPEFWTDPTVVGLPMAARLFFVGTWNYADDYGVMGDEPDRLKMQIMPADDVDAAEVVDQLVDAGLLLRRTAPDGTKVLVIRTFGRHQKIDRRTVGRWGDPAEWAPSEPAEPQPSTPDPAESRLIPPDPAESPPIPPKEGKGRERKGREESRAIDAGSGGVIELRTGSGSPPAVARDDAFGVFWAEYPRKVSKPAARKAWRRATKRAGPDVILEGLRRHVGPWETFEPEFIPHASTWLNGDRWADEPPRPRVAEGTRDRPAVNRAKIAESIGRLQHAGGAR